MKIIALLLFIGCVYIAFDVSIFEKDNKNKDK